MLNEPVPEELQKLRDLSQKIQKLMKDADVAGTVNLQSKSFAEWAIVIDPSWSLLRWDHSGPHPGIRFVCKFKTGTPEEKEMGRLTAGLLNGLVHVTSIQHNQLDNLRRLMSSKASITTTVKRIDR